MTDIYIIGRTVNKISRRCLAKVIKYNIVIKLSIVRILFCVILYTLYYREGTVVFIKVYKLQALVITQRIIGVLKKDALVITKMTLLEIAFLNKEITLFVAIS